MSTSSTSSTYDELSGARATVSHNTLSYSHETCLLNYPDLAVAVF
jgi:hypothetical protein